MSMVCHLLTSNSVKKKRKEKKQTKRTSMDLFPKMMKPQEEPQAGPSGGVRGEGSSLHAIAPADIPVRQEVGVKDNKFMILTLCRPTLMRVFVSLFLATRFKN